MSWSLSCSGTQQEVNDYLDNVAPGAIAHVTGVERALADQTLGLLRATAAASVGAGSIKVSASGSATFDGQQNQTLQTINFSVAATA